MRWLPGCLASIEAQTVEDIELLVLDNASSDGTLEWLREEEARLPWLHVQRSEVNLGFAAAQNRNIYRAKADFICLLNQDVVLDSGFLEAALAAFAGRPRVGAIQGLLLKLADDGARTDLIDTTGLVMFRSRRVISRGQGQQDGPEWQSAGPVWGADGPAPVYRKAALLDVQEPRTAGGWEVLDEDFVMYKEDVDLAWRLRKRGWGVIYEPAAKAWHARTAGVGDASSLLDVARSNWQIDPWIKAISWRNQRLMQIKNESSASLLADLPWLWVREALSLAFILVSDVGRLIAVPQLVRKAPDALRKRTRRAPSS